MLISYTCLQQRGGDKNLLTNYAYKLIPNKSQSAKMSKWVDMLRGSYNWCLGDRIANYETHFMEGAYCDLRTRSERTPVSCCVSKYGATGEPWVESKPKLRNAGDIQITALPTLKKARPWYSDIDSTVLQQNIKRLDTAYKNFFEGKGFPKFKNRSNFTSFTFAAGAKLQGSRLYLPKMPTVLQPRSGPLESPRL